MGTADIRLRIYTPPFMAGFVVDPQAVAQDPADIPTLGEWAAILLAFALIALGIRRLRAPARPVA